MLFRFSHLAIAAILFSSACGDNIAADVAGSYLGELTTGTVNETDYTITVSEVDNDTIAISGDDFATFEVDLVRSGDTQITAVTGTTVLNYDAVGDLQFTYNGADTVVFDGSILGE